MLMANTAEDAIVPHVLPFVQQYVPNEDWRYRDAAVYALGKCVRVSVCLCVCECVCVCVCVCV